jgi:gamma-glutamyltranspeptidase/glutathione hydrolase
MTDWNWAQPYPARRAPLMARNAVATSQSLASQAGLHALARGGNAVDAALAAAITLTVVEPTMNGLGGDCFAIVSEPGSPGTLHGLNASGRAPAGWSAAWIRDRHPGATVMPKIGWDSVTVPGQVSGWVALSKRFGKLPFADLFEAAIRYARDGFSVTPVIARQWQTYAGTLHAQPGFGEFLLAGRAPRPGERWRMPAQAATLEEIAATGGESFYRGPIAARIAAFARACGATLTESDLAAQQPEWVSPIAQDYRGTTVHELPPNGQGIAALMALGIAQHLPIAETQPDTADRIHLQVEAMRLAFADAHAQVTDPAHMRVTPAQMLDPGYLAQRARRVDPKRTGQHPPGTLPGGGTVYLCAADASGMMVSLIQSNYSGFGSGVVVPGTGISLHNRGSAFSLADGHPNLIEGGKRPFHTIIPAFLTRNGQPLGPFGVMGANMQPQGHLQLVMRMVDDGMNPQASADGPRWRITDDGKLLVEAAVGQAVADELARRGHPVSVAPPDSLDFGSAQMIVRMSDDLADGYYAASEHRRDGQAVGF